MQLFGAYILLWTRAEAYSIDGLDHLGTKWLHRQHTTVNPSIFSSPRDCYHMLIEKSPVFLKPVLYKDTPDIHF